MARRRQTENSFGNRLIAAKLIAFIGLAVLGVRLWYLQCLQGNYYRDLSENNRSRTIRTQAPRGIIYDRFGRIVVRNRPAFQIALMLEDTPNVAETVSEIAEITGRDTETLLRRFESE